jgi:glycosyltransferase involved in cell wall biosynthesis
MTLDPTQMNSISVIVTAHNNALLIRQALQSVEESASFLRRQGGQFADLRCEVVVVDDGSRDGTDEAIADFIAGRGGYTTLRRPHPTSPSSARNDGAAASRGDLLFFLDGDDCFRENHLFECWQALQHRGFGFVKTQVDLSHPVLPEWRDRIRNSIVINICVRRACHEFVGGFPDYQVVTRRGETLSHDLDPFFKIEDVFYNQLLARNFRGADCPMATVVYHRHPGNSFDRQYAKFQLPPGQYRDPPNPDLDLRVKLCNLLMEYHCGKLASSPRPDGL